MLFGRSRELERIDRLLALARSGQCGALLILGEPGIGKTALLDVARARARPMRVLAAHGVPSEAEIPFAGLLELVRPLLGDLSRLPERQAVALRGALGIGSPVPGDRFLIGAATLSLLAVAAESRPVMVVIDDAHWLDGESLDAVLFAVRRLDADAVATLIAARTDALPLEGVGGLDTLDLAGLGATETAQLAESRLGRRLNEPDAARVFGLTRGNPLAVIEIGANAQAAFDAPAILSRSVEDAYSRRLGDLTLGVRSLLLVAAIDASLDVAKVERAASAMGVTTTLADAEASGLIELTDGLVVFRHPLVRSAVYQSASAAQRRQAHAAIGRTLEGDAHAGRRAWHEAAASIAPDEPIAAALEAAADEARDRGGYQAAAAALERAAHLTPDPGPRARRLYRAAASAFSAGRTELARRLLRGTLVVCDDPLLRADIQLLHGGLLRASGAAQEASELLLREGRRVAPLDPQRAALMLSRSALNALHRGATADGLRIGREAGTLVGNADGSLVLRVNSTLGHALILAGHPEEAEPLLRGFVSATHASTEGDAVLMDLRAVNLMYLGEYRGAREVAVEAIDLARSQGALGVLPAAGETLASAQLILGNWDDAIATATESLRLSYDTHQSQYGVWLCYILAEIAAARGRRDECLAHVAEADELAGGRASWAGHGLADMALGLH